MAKLQITGLIGVIASMFFLGSAQAQEPPPHFRKVVIVVFENTDYTAAMRGPFFKKFAAGGALLAQFSAETHPSQGNYIAMVAGDTFGIRHDGSISLENGNIVDLLEAKGRTWKAYAENYPGHCFNGSSHAQYARKHNPFISHSNIRGNPSRCANIVDATEFQTDLHSAKLPDYSYFIPNLRNDGHDTGVLFADSWFEKTFGPALQDPEFAKDVLLIATFDENGGRPGNQIYTALVGSNVAQGRVINDQLNHYSLLRLIEEEWSLGDLGRNDATAARIQGIWK